MRFVLLLGLVAALLPIAAAASTRAAQVAVVSHSPVTVRGTGFHRYERVVVTVSARESRTRKIYATARGSFRAVFKGYSFTYCEPYAVRAKGNRGSTAFVRIIPECPSQGPED